MKLIVPMAGLGKRMRPHTLTTPKPLIPVGGKTIVQRLVEEIAGSCNEEIEEIAFIIGPFGARVEESLMKIGHSIGAKVSLFYQTEAKGTAHAILCAADCLNGKIIIAFADTLFKADFHLPSEKTDGVIWVKQVQDPAAFGVVKVDQNQVITDFVEKPDKFVSDLAIIGIYFFRDGKGLRIELEFLIENNILDKGEFQLTSALQNMKNKGKILTAGKVNDWLDCGNKESTLYSNSRVLDYDQAKGLISDACQKSNSIIIPPCYIGENVKLKNSVIGPYVSIGNDTLVEDSLISNSIVQSNTSLIKVQISNSMIGNHVHLKDCRGELNFGDFCTQNQ